MGGELRQIAHWDDAVGHLRMLTETVKRDLFPLRRRDQGGCTAEGAPHTISREVCCYIDYLGALYTGWVEPNRSGRRFAAYLSEVMGGQYASNANLIREMYRNGPVHEFDPKVVFNSRGDTCGWLESVGESPGTYDFSTGTPIEIRHLHVVAHPAQPNTYYLPVFSSNLLNDLVSSMETFAGFADNRQARVLCWNRSAAALCQPVRFDGFVPPNGK